MPNLALYQQQPLDAIIGRQPSWIVRSGITLIVAIVILLLSLTWLIKYPDRINTTIRLTTIHPPVSIPARVNGRVMRMFAANGDSVSAGQPLLLLENNLSYRSYEQLEHWVSALSRWRGQPETESLPAPVILEEQGPLQLAVNRLHLLLNDIQAQRNPDQFELQVEGLQGQIDTYERLSWESGRKLELLEKKRLLEQSLLFKNREQKRKGLITDAELVQMENNYLDKQLAIRDVRIQRELYQAQKEQISQKLTEVKFSRAEKNTLLMTRLDNEILLLQSEMNEWEQEYLIKATVMGELSLSHVWSANQYLKRGEIAVNIIDSSQQPIGKIQLSQTGAGKVKIGQRVNISLDSYPEAEYGVLIGHVKSISLIPSQQGYLVDVELPNPLLSTHGELLPFSPELKGQAQIVTAEKRLLSRFVEKLLYVF